MTFKNLLVKLGLVQCVVSVAISNLCNSIVVGNPLAKIIGLKTVSEILNKYSETS